MNPLTVPASVHQDRESSHRRRPQRAAWRRPVLALAGVTGGLVLALLGCVVVPGYVAPAPVVYAPRPVYVAPAPVVVYGWGWRRY